MLLVSPLKTPFIYGMFPTLQVQSLSRWMINIVLSQVLTGLKMDAI